MIKVGNYYVNETALNDPIIQSVMKSYDLRLQQQAVERDRIKRGKSSHVPYTVWDISDRD